MKKVILDSFCHEILTPEIDFQFKQYFFLLSKTIPFMASVDANISFQEVALYNFCSDLNKSMSYGSLKICGSCIKIFFWMLTISPAVVQLNL